PLTSKKARRGLRPRRADPGLRERSTRKMSIFARRMREPSQLFIEQVLLTERDLHAPILPGESREERAARQAAAADIIDDLADEFAVELRPVSCRYGRAA